MSAGARVTSLTTSRRRAEAFQLAVSRPPFQRFLDAHREDVWRFLVASVGRDAADDCFQETFLSALRAYPQAAPATTCAPGC